MKTRMTLPSEYRIDLMQRVTEPEDTFYYCRRSWTIPQDIDSDEFTVTIPAELISTGGIYQVGITAGRSGYDPMYTAEFFYAMDPQSKGILRLPDGLTRIEEGAFEGGAFEAVIIPDGCTEVGAEAFRNCRNLVYVSYPAGTSFGTDAFTDSYIEIWDER